MVLRLDDVAGRGSHFMLARGLGSLFMFLFFELTNWRSCFRGVALDGRGHASRRRLVPIRARRQDLEN